MSGVIMQKHSRVPRKLSRLTLRRREKEATGGTLSEASPKAIISRYMAGEKIRKIAGEYGVSRIAVYAFLLQFAPEEWIAAQKAKAFAMKEEGEDGITESQDALDLGIAREQLRAGQWDLERVMRKEYGRDEQNITINVLDLGDRLRRAKERTQAIESEISTPLALDLRAGDEKPALEHQSEAQLAARPGPESDVQPQQSGAAMTVNPT